ncbi:recombinase family protein [Vagococcus sp. BWB3-3]|uniref:Recombinase family protein n=1 Tax=Vagococcus allomyrinae TaxID=2794353 RepID=A0A940P7E0_9ENTE|nr:recombinase family protein [Vagococcus allomyrinae]MBP1039415.1 recombinase family protein [Vagococcus allomyrinae]
MASYGYIKKTSEMTKIIEQVNTISQYEVANIFIDDDNTSVEFQVLYESLEKGDSLVITSLSVFEQTLRQLEELFLKLHELNIRLIIVNEGIDTSESSSSNYFRIMLDLVQMEKVVAKQLTLKRMAKARENGIVGGRPSLAQKVIDEIIYLRKQHKKSIRQIASECDVSVGSVYKYVTQNEELNTIVSEKEEFGVR